MYFLPFIPILRLSHSLRSSNSWIHSLAREMWLSESESILKYWPNAASCGSAFADQCQEIKRPMVNEASPPSAPVYFLSAGHHFLSEHNHWPSTYHCTVKFSPKTPQKWPDRLPQRGWLKFYDFFLLLSFLCLASLGTLCCWGSANNTQYVH